MAVINVEHRFTDTATYDQDGWKITEIYLVEFDSVSGSDRPMVD